MKTNNLDFNGRIRGAFFMLFVSISLMCSLLILGSCAVPVPLMIPIVDEEKSLPDEYQEDNFVLSDSGTFELLDPFGD